MEIYACFNEELLSKGFLYIFFSSADFCMSFPDILSKGTTAGWAKKAMMD